ncbi:MAG: FAD binding domain-containing protein [bacterium]
MFPSTFEYVRAKSVQDALSWLAKSGGKAKLLAGGHSLIPAMKLRLNSPATLVDITGIGALAKISKTGSKVHVGALATHRMVEYSDVVKSNCQVLAEVASGIGDPQVRNHGTIGGSLAHADPSADYPAIVLALGAEIEASSKAKKRVIPADKFFKGLFETALSPKEMITRISFPVLGKGKAAAYAKFPHPASRFAVAGVAVMVAVDGKGKCKEARVAVTGAAPSVFRATAVEEALIGEMLNEETINSSAEKVAHPADLLSDLIASAEYRAHLCMVMAKRALQMAVSRI